MRGGLRWRPGASTSVPDQVARVDAAAGSDLTNLATATSATPDPIDANNTDVTTVSTGSPPWRAAIAASRRRGGPSADLVLSKRALDQARVGRPLRYAITVENQDRRPRAGS